MEEFCGREVVRVRRGSAASRLGMRVGDQLWEVNGKRVNDVLDAQFFAADDVESLCWKRAGREYTAIAPKPLSVALGLEFQHPTFDTAIRRCNNRCRFCFVVQMAPGLRGTLHIKDDDYRFSFLYGHFVTLTNLRSSDWKKIVEQRLSPLYVSVHATEPDLRVKLLGNPRAGEILDQLKVLTSAGIEIHAQVVVAPNWNDGSHLRCTVDDLVGLYPRVRTCSVVPVGLTRFHRQGLRIFTAKEKQEMVDEIEAWQHEFYHRLGTKFVFLTDEWYLSADRPVPALEETEELDLRENGLGLVRSFLDEWAGLLHRSRVWGKKVRGARAVLATGALFAPVLSQVIDECNQQAGSMLQVAAIENRQFGASVTVAGLLMVKDVIQQLIESNLLPDQVILPRIMFDHPQAFSLDNRTPLDVAKALGVTICLANSMSDVIRALAGESELCVRPKDRKISRNFLRAGGWSG
jgi:putative radical SAM enzyme (TIGR03279 family)